MSFLIPDDGYTEQGMIAGRPGLHGPIRFTYRPATPKRVAQWSTPTANAEASSAADSKFIADQVKAWEELNDIGEVKAELPKPTVRMIADQVRHADRQTMIRHILGSETTNWEAIRQQWAEREGNSQPE